MAIFGSSFILIMKTWDELTALLDTKELSLQYDEDDRKYELFAIDGAIVYLTNVYKGDDLPMGVDPATNTTALSEFEGSYKTSSNKKQRLLTVLDAPHERDRKPVVTMSPATEGFVTWICGAGDDPNPTPPSSGRGLGEPFIIHFTGSGHMVKEFEFSEPLEIHDGQIVWREPEAWNADDKFSVGVRIPATVVSASSPANTGNCSLVPVGPGMNIVVPAVSGTHVLVSASPVEDRNETGGYWNVDYGTGAISPNLNPGEGEWNLFDFDIRSALLKKIPMNHPMGVFDIDVYKVEYFHPSWRLYWDVERVSSGSGTVSGWIFAFRRNIT